MVKAPNFLKGGNLENGAGRKAGGLDVRITPEILVRLRNRVKEIKEKDPKVPYAVISRSLTSEFPDYAAKTLEDYCLAVGKATDYIFSLYIEGKVSFTLFLELIQTKLKLKEDEVGVMPGDLDYIAREFVEAVMPNGQKPGMPELRRIKANLRTQKNGQYMSIPEALGRGLGRISAFAKPEALKKISKSFDSLLDEINKHMTLARAKTKQLIDLLPMSTLNKGKVHSELFNKVYLLRHILGEQYDFVDNKVKVYLDELVRFTATETQLDELRRRTNSGDGQGSGGQEVGEAAAQEVHGAGQAVPDADGQHPGEGRVEA